MKDFPSKISLTSEGCVGNISQAFKFTTLLRTLSGDGRFVSAQRTCCLKITAVFLLVFIHLRLPQGSGGNLI